MSPLNSAILVCFAVLTTIGSYYAEAKNIQYLQLAKGWQATLYSDSRLPVRAFKGEPLDIVLGEHEYNYVECHNAQKSKFPVSLNYDKALTIIKVPVVSVDMSTKWKCTFSSFDDTFSTSFDFHVIAAEFPNVTIDGKELKLTVTNSTSQNNSETYYDGFSYYTYEDGANIDFNCWYPDRDIYAKLCSSQGEVIKDYARDNNFKIPLSSQNNGQWIACEVKSKEDVFYRYKIILNLNQSESYNFFTNISPANMSSEMFLGLMLLILFVVVMATVVFYIFWRKRNLNARKKDDQSDLVQDSNESETNHSKCRGTLTEECINELYAMPMKKSERRTMESHYTEPIELNIYSVPVNTRN